MGDGMKILLLNNKIGLANFKKLYEDLSLNFLISASYPP